MSYLHKLVNVLREDELEKIQAMSLPGREREVLLRILDFRHRELPEKADLVSALHISSQHFDKVCSVLLDKCYTTLVPGRGVELLHYLNRKDLYKHFVHEMRQQEKLLIRDSPEKAEDFYLNSFELLQTISYKHHDRELIREYGDKYLASLAAPTEGDRIFVEARMLCSELLVIAAKGAALEQRNEMFHQLGEHAEKLMTIRHTLALYAHYWGMAGYYTYMDSQPDKMLDFLKKSYVLCLENPRELSVGRRTMAQLKIGEAYYACSEFREAFRIYLDIFSEYPERIKKEYYHTTKFIQVCIILGEFDRAQALLEERFGTFMSSRLDTMTTMAALSYAKLYLCKGEPVEAKKFIDLGFELNTKSYYMQYEIELRNLQNCYFYMAGDLELAEDLARKNLKFLNSRGFTLENSTYGYYYKMLLACIDMKEKKTSFPKSLEEKYELYQTSYYAIYGKLVHLMRFGIEAKECESSSALRLTGVE